MKNYANYERFSIGGRSGHRYVNSEGAAHRLDGPAIIFDNGDSSLFVVSGHLYRDEDEYWELSVTGSTEILYQNNLEKLFV